MQAAALSVLIYLGAACSTGDADRSDALIADLETRIPSVVSSGNSPSMQVAVVHRDRIIWSRGFGEDPSIYSIYMNGSVQKVFTSVAVLQLVEQGILDLDADVGSYLPFEVRHPGYPDRRITLRTMLGHRSGLGAAPHQFDWDTDSTFTKYRPACPPELLEMSLERFLVESLTPEGINYDEGIWVARPDSRYHYALIVAPMLRYMIGQVAGESFPNHMQKNIFDPLGLANSGYSAEPFAERNIIPHTRIDGKNIELPIWGGNGYMMRTTAEDQARLMLALMGDGRVGAARLLRPETVKLMRARTSRFKVLFESSPDIQHSGEGLGLNLFRGGWIGFGGSTPGYQCLWRFHPSRQVGYVILSNVNAILGGGDNYASARADIYEVQDALLAVLDPTLKVRSRAAEAAIVGLVALASVLAIGHWWRRRPARRLRDQPERA